MKRRARAALAVATLLCVATACSRRETPATPLPPVDVFQQQLEMAKAGGASQDQIYVLSRAAEAGTMTFDDIMLAQDSLVGCLETAGFSVEVQTPYELAVGSGIVVPDYLATPPGGTPTSATDAVFDACNVKEIEFAMSAYVSQPVAMEAQMAQWDSPKVRDCLVARGYTVDPESTGAELNAMVGDDIEKHGQDPGFNPCLP